MARNRSEGWLHAKVDGHENESRVAERLKSSPDLLQSLRSQFGYSPCHNSAVEVDGNKRVKSILGGVTVAKTDLALRCSDGVVNFSIKKSASGQVWLVPVRTFLRLMELRSPYPLSDDFNRGLRLFIGGEENLMGLEESYSKGLSHSDSYFPKRYQLEKHQARLSFSTIQAVDRFASEALSEGLKANIELITNLAFCVGAAMHEDDFADVILYNNSANGMMGIKGKEMAYLSSGLSEFIAPGPRSGGTTIWLPWGFLQMHRPQGTNEMQFHHKQSRIEAHYPELTRYIEI